MSQHFYGKRASFFEILFPVLSTCQDSPGVLVRPRGAYGRTVEWQWVGLEGTCGDHLVQPRPQRPLSRVARGMNQPGLERRGLNSLNFYKKLDINFLINSLLFN